MALIDGITMGGVSVHLTVTQVYHQMEMHILNKLVLKDQGLGQVVLYLQNTS